MILQTSKRILLTIVTLFILGNALFPYQINALEERISWWDIQSIDTMKYSRDLAREKIDDTSFNQTIDNQVQKIAQTGATHVAIGTPYDDEFIPYLSQWVSAARKNGLNVWFRGNLSGWEGWFGYPKISRDEHTQLVNNFVNNNLGLFQDGDIFDPCIECENGGPGDPRQTQDIKNYRSFLINEYQGISEIFKNNNKNVLIVYSMNGDVARLIMDQTTTSKLGGTVTIDHYIKDPELYIEDLNDIVERSGGKVLFGEIGAPVPDIHGLLSESEQAQWIDKAFRNLSQNNNLLGVNYWVSFGGSTKIWETNGKARGIVIVIEKYYKPNVLKGRVINELNKPIGNTIILNQYRTVNADKNGYFSIPYIEDSAIEISSRDYVKKVITTNDIQGNNLVFILKKEKESIFFKLAKSLIKLLNYVKN